MDSVWGNMIVFSSFPQEFLVFRHIGSAGKPAPEEIGQQINS